MNNETLKRDLCSRLMYGVKVEVLDYKSDYVGKKIDEIIGITQWSKCGKLWSIETKGGAKPSFEKITPILFPTSALTKEIQIANYNDGKPFIPIEEIDSLASTNKEVNQIIEWDNSENHFLINVHYFIGGWEITFIIDKLNQWHINYRLSPDQFIEVTDAFNPYK